MSKIISLFVGLALLLSCRPRDESGLKNGVAVGDGGRTILFKKAGNAVLIKECVDDPEDLSTRKDCDKKSGTLESRPSPDEVRNHLKAVLKVSAANFSEEMKGKVDLYSEGKLDTAELENQRNRLKKQLENVRKFIQSVKGDNRQEIAKLKGSLARVERQLQGNNDLVSAVREINGLINKLVDEIILGPLGFIVFLYNYTDKQTRFFFNILDSYIKNPKMGWKFVQMSKVNGKGFPVSFSMGSNEYSYEKPIHLVTLTKDFSVQTTEVTQFQWFQIMGSNPSRFSKRDNCNDYDATRELCPNHPVENVSWDAVQEFIKKLNAKGDGYTYRLPTEAEWEYFARAGTTTPFNLGENINTNKVNYNGNYPYKDATLGVYRKQTVAVGSLGNGNRFGLHDTHGNVWEWVSDWYRRDYYKNSPGTNPAGPPSPHRHSILRVLRGGSWFYGAKDCRSATRYYWTPTGSAPYVGFRLVRTGSP